MEYRPINLDDKLRKVTDHWSPKVIAKMNDYRFKLVKFKGEFVWHSHADTDEAFLVIDGTLTVYFRDGSVDISGGELFVVPRGVEHKTFAGRECHAMLVERAGTINTGDVVSDLTAEDDVWI